MAERKIWRITGKPGEYDLVDHTDTVVRTGPKPSKLADYAFHAGADEVSHDYDLVDFEERQTWGR